MADTPIAHVTDTALWVAAYRALENERPDALVRDPYADRLTGSRGREIAEALKSPAPVGWSVVIRTVVIDRFLTEAIAGGVDTVLNLGAGLDARPYRLDLPPGLTWIEVDYPDMIARKEERLAGETPRCRLERRKVDLADDAARRELLRAVAGRAKKAMVLTEGVVPYLPIGAVGQLADELRALPAYSGWIVDYFAPELMRWFTKSRMRRSLRNAPFLFNPPDWHGFFAAHGWRPRALEYLPEVGAALGRPGPRPWWLVLLRLAMSAERKAEIERLMGYAWLEPG